VCLDVRLNAYILTLMTNEVWIFFRVTMDSQYPYTRFRESIWPLSVSCLELAKYFKFLPQLYCKHAAELLVVRRHYSIGYNKLSDGSMSLGVHSLQEVTPCYPKKCECYILLCLLYFGNINSGNAKFRGFISLLYRGWEARAV